MAKLLSIPFPHTLAPLIFSKIKTLLPNAKPSHSISTIAMASPKTSSSVSPSFNVFDSHLHVWATPEQASEKYPYFPGQEPSLRGDVDFLLECMDEAGVEGALIVQPINHMFDHSYVTSVLKKYPSKFLGCLLANPADDGSGIKQLEDLVLKDDYRAVRFNPYLWPSGQKMTNNVGKALFAKAGELGVPVGFMLFKGLNLHIDEVEELCTEYPDTKVILDHVSFCKPPSNEEEKKALSSLLQLSRFPQVHLKFSALFRVSREKPPYEDLVPILSQLITTFGSKRIIWGSDFPYVVPESGYKGALEAAKYLSDKVEKELSSGLEFSLRENDLFSKK